MAQYVETVGLLNADMYDTAHEPYERTWWHRPDYYPVDYFEDLVQMSVEQYAENYPHMIVFQVFGNER